MQSLQCALKLERILVRASRTVALCTTADQLVNFENAAHDLDRSLLRVWPDFITAEEETRLFEEVAPLLRRRRYSKNHWDSVIVNFRETERAWAAWELQNQKTLEHARVTIDEALGSSKVDDFLDSAHIVDISPNGYISPHVDSVKASGNFVAGLSLLSTSQMTLRYRPGMSEGDGWNLELESDSVVNVTLPRRSLYLISGDLRFKYTHAVSVDTGCRRISIIFRGK